MSELPAELPTIPGHRLVRLLGQGGMGVVYLAEDVVLGRQAAIKLVSERGSGDADARARFLREARSMATIEHPHVVRVYSFGETAGTAYLVMEYVPGEALSERLKRSGALGVDEALKVTRQVVEALEAAWEKRLVHRDIKPSNILFDGKGTVRVADFGLAKPLSVNSDDASLTQTGLILGTPHYMSPEQARGRPVDLRSDIYSLGIVLFQMLAGRRPFEGTTPFDIVARHLHEPLPPFGQRDLPPGVVELVTWMTQKDPAERPPSYPALSARLLALAGPGAATPPPSPAGRRGTWARRSPLLRRQETSAFPEAAGGPRLRASFRLLMAGVGTLAAALFWWGHRGGTTSLGERPDQRLIVAVTPFYGPDDDSAKEGRVMAALVEKAVRQRLGGEDARVIGVDQTRVPVRDHAAARALGDQLGANAVVWGEAVALRGETEIQPYLTLVPRRAAKASASVHRENLLGNYPTEALEERAGASLLMGAQAPNQIELRKTGAAGVGDLVLVLAGSQALAVGHPERALALFSQAPRTAESLRHRADALLALKQTDDAQSALADAVALDPQDAQSQASLADLLLAGGRFADAAGVYRRAATGRAYGSREGILCDNKLYARETYRAVFRGETLTVDSGYLLGLDPETGRVLERHSLPGALRRLTPGVEGFTVTYEAGNSDDAFYADAGFSQGRFTRPVFPPTSLWLRRRGAECGRHLGANFLPSGSDDETDFRPRGQRDDVPRDFASLEAALRQARERDPTLPWYPFLQGQAAWSQGRHADAEQTWEGLFAGTYPEVRYETYAYMARDFERLGQRPWADRAYDEALRRRRMLPAVLPSMLLIERLMLLPFVSEAARALSGGGDPQRAYAWLLRTRELAGVTENDAFAAAAWETYFHERGDGGRAKAEAAFRRRAAADPLNFDGQIVLLDYAIVLVLGLNLAFWVVLSGLLLSALRRARAGGAADRVPFRATIAALLPRERRVLVLSFLAALTAYVPVALQAGRLGALVAMPISLTDSLGSATALKWLDSRLDGSGGDAPTRFVAAVAHHLAGDLEAAHRIYGSLGDDWRAHKNMEALAKGVVVPPEQITSNDLLAASASRSGTTWSQTLWPLGTFLRYDFDTPDPFTPAVWLTLALGVALLPLLLVTPAVGGMANRSSAGRTRLLTVVPGLGDLTTGKPVRGALALSLATLSLTALVYALCASREGVPMAGVLTAKNLASVARSSPMPAHNPWAPLWLHRGATLYWSAVGIATLSAIGLQATALRRVPLRPASSAALDPTTGAPDPDQETPLWP